MADCSYNGRCDNGTCICIPQFTGDKCDRFNFLPIDTASGTGLRTIDQTGNQVGGCYYLAPRLILLCNNCCHCCQLSIQLPCDYYRCYRRCRCYHCTYSSYSCFCCIHMVCFEF